MDRRRRGPRAWTVRGAYIAGAGGLGPRAYIVGAGRLNLVRRALTSAPQSAYIAAAGRGGLRPRAYILTVECLHSARMPAFAYISWKNVYLHAKR